MADLSPGATFAGHRIDGIAGRGGMGTVYRATHLALDHEVALKVISTDLAVDEAFRERFRSESRIAVSLRHPNVVPIHHAGEEEGLLFVTMDLVDGPDLRRLLIAGGPLAPERAAGLVEQVASALDVAHSRGLVHRDIKPGNVLIEQREDGEHAFLTDFGLAKRFDADASRAGLTGTGAFVGTLDYVAPEQIRGDRVDARTDVYALGCVLYEAISGRAPFVDREENVAKIYAHLQDEPPWLPGDGDGDLDEVIGRAMAKEPRERFPSAGDLADAAVAAAAGVESRTAERSVATGRAAPLTPQENPVDLGATEAMEPPPPPSGEAAEEPPPAEPPPTERLARRDRPPRGAVIGGIAALVVIALVAVLALGGGEDPAPDGVPAPRPELAGPPIEIEGFPLGVAVHDNQVTVATRDGESLVTLEKETGEAGPPIDLGGQGEDVAIVGDVAYVTLPNESALAKVPLTGGEVEEIAVGEDPRGITAIEGELWVANRGSASISRIDVATDEPTEVPLGEGTEPNDIAFDGEALWITDRPGNAVIRLVPGEVDSQSFPVGDNPKGVVVLDDEVWVANTDSGDVTRLDLEGNVIDTYTVEGSPRGVASGLDHVWVANGGDNPETGPGWITAINPETGAVQSLQLEGSPEEVAEGPKRMWVTTGSGDTLAPVDPPAIATP